MDGIRVLDLSQVLPGGLCTQILADLGAEVIKIENPEGGDKFRKTPPMMGDTGVYFYMCNRNKKSVTLNIFKEEGRRILRLLVPKVDVLVENFRPGTMDKLGLGYEELKRLNSRLVYCSISGYGQDGPYSSSPAHDLNLLAISGILDVLSTADGVPIVPAIQIGGISGGIHAALGIVAALMKRERTGRGDYVDVAILDTLSHFLLLPMGESWIAGLAMKGTESQVGGGKACYNVYKTKDGKYLAVGCLEEKFWREFCRALGRPDFEGDRDGPPERQKEMIRIIKDIFLSRTQDEWLTHFRGYDVIVTPVLTFREVLDHPQVNHRSLWITVCHDGTNIILQRFPILFRREVVQSKVSFPALGEHTFSVLTELGFRNEEIEILKEQGVI